ncbi:hypothetical protein V6N13_028492 [Hibiscus sabdariffa]
MSTKPTKSRTPKKRSITEIFAAAFHIHKVDAPGEHENGSLEKELNSKIERPKKKKKVAIVKKLVNKRRKLKNKKNNKKGRLIANKVMCGAPAVQYGLGHRGLPLATGFLS